MCDYSLESAARRDAVVGDQLKTARIGVHGTVGLVAPDDASTAVCLMPGARLVISGIPAVLQQRWGVSGVAIATFRKRGGHGAYQGPMGFYHDGVIFDGTDGAIVLFQDFPLELGVSVETLLGAPCEMPRAAPREFVLT